MPEKPQARQADQMGEAPVIDDLPTLPEGSTWQRCALQVNPFGYLDNFDKGNSRYPDEDTYNAAIIEALERNSITVIGITDHWRVDSGERLRAAVEAAGITVFPGFEATSKEGVHLLVLFDPSVDAVSINRRLGACGIPADCNDARPGKRDTLELLADAESWGAVVVAPHVTTGGGLLGKLSGQSAAIAWKDSRLHAVAHSGAKLDQKSSDIISNKAPEYRRSNHLAVLHAADVSCASDVEKPGSSCWIKLSSMSITGLDLAFRTPNTRVSLTDPNAAVHARVMGMSWNGGFLDGVTVRFNESLNVLIGGRGSGKSTIIESLRYALNILPVAKTAKDEHLAMVTQVLGSGTKIRIQLQLRTPSNAIYVVDRIVGNKPVVRRSTGEIVHSTPAEIIGGVEVYGQRELAELARDRERLTQLLAQYLPKDSSMSGEGGDLKHQLERSRNEILRVQEDIATLEQQLSLVPTIEERLRRFNEAGVGEKLEDHEKSQQENQLLNRAKESVDQNLPFGDWQIEAPYLIDEETLELPRKSLLVETAKVIDIYNKTVKDAVALAENARSAAIEATLSIQTRWDAETRDVRGALEKVLRQLQPDGVDGNEYLRLRRELGELRPKQGIRETRDAELQELKRKREELLIQAEEQRADRLRELQREAKKVARKLPGTVQASVQDGSDRSLLTDIIDREIPGRLDSVRASINSKELLSPRALVSTIRQGRDAIVSEYKGVTPNQAATLAKASDEVLMRIEEVDFPISTDLELNVGAKDNPIWKSLDRLSTGQKATALLLLLMNRGTGPLVIDQPEDDLDNRFIYEDIVPRLRDTKGKRQVIFSSHNANIPVLGDADQIVALAASDGPNGVNGEIVQDGLGSIDHPPIRIVTGQVVGSACRVL